MRKRQKPIETLKRGEVEALIGVASRRAPTGIRNAALIALFYFSGLRVAEALALEVRDLDLEAGVINVRRGKGAKQRIVGVGAAALPYLDRWTDARRSLGISKGPVFCTLKGRPLADCYVREFLSRYAVKASIAKRVHPHGLRHSHAAHLAMSGIPTHAIQKQLGHNSLATTGQYLDSIAPAEVISAVAAAWE